MGVYIVDFSTSLSSEVNNNIFNHITYMSCNVFLLEYTLIKLSFFVQIADSCNISVLFNQHH